MRLQKDSKHAWKWSNPMIGGFILSILAIICLPCIVSAVEDNVITPQQLFRLSYGDQDSQIGIDTGETGEGPPAGPIGFAVGPTGDIYISDRIQRKIKRFDRNGRLIFATEGKIDNMSSPSVAPDGSVWVRAGAGVNDLVRFDAKGNRMGPTEDFAVVEIRDADPILGQVDRWMKQHNLRPHPYLAKVVFDEQGRMYLGVYGNSIPPRDYWNLGIFVFDPKGKLTGFMRGHIIGLDGCIYKRLAKDSKTQSITISAYTYEGAKVFDTMVPAPDSAAAILRWRKDNDVGISQFIADKNFFYIKDAIGRKDIGKAPIVLDNELTIFSDLSVVKTDRGGRLLAAFRIPRGPFLYCRPLYITPDGDIYFLSFGESSLAFNYIPQSLLQFYADKRPDKIVTIAEMTP